MAIIRRDESHVWQQRFAVFRHICSQSGRQSLTLGEYLMWHLQHVGQHEAQPLEVNGWLWAYSRLVISPFIIGHAQRMPQFRLLFVLFQALGKDGEQHRHTEKWAGDLDQRQPLGVLTGNGHDTGYLSSVPCVPAQDRSRRPGRGAAAGRQNACGYWLAPAQFRRRSVQRVQPGRTCCARIVPALPC